jgi:hypothetical protein
MNLYEFKQILKNIEKNCGNDIEIQYSNDFTNPPKDIVIHFQENKKNVFVENGEVKYNLVRKLIICPEKPNQESSFWTHEEENPFKGLLVGGAERVPKLVQKANDFFKELNKDKVIKTLHSTIDDQNEDIEELKEMIEEKEKEFYENESKYLKEISSWKKSYNKLKERCGDLESTITRLENVHFEVLQNDEHVSLKEKIIDERNRIEFGFDQQDVDSLTNQDHVECKPSVELVSKEDDEEIKKMISQIKPLK